LEGAPPNSCRSLVSCVAAKLKDGEISISELATLWVLFVAKTGGSVTLTVCATEVAVSPLVVFDAVTVNVFTGDPVPLKEDASIRPLMVAPGVVEVIVYVSPFGVTVSPGAVMVSKLGTPVIVIDTVSSLSTGDAVMPIDVDVPGDTVREVELTVTVGASAVVSRTTVTA
jgi:hypothetical protein